MCSFSSKDTHSQVTHSPAMLCVDIYIKVGCMLDPRMRHVYKVLVHGCIFTRFPHFAYEPMNPCVRVNPIQDCALQQGRANEGQVPRPSSRGVGRVPYILLCSEGQRNMRPPTPSQPLQLHRTAPMSDINQPTPSHLLYFAVHHPSSSRLV